MVRLPYFRDSASCPSLTIGAFGAALALVPILFYRKIWDVAFAHLVAWVPPPMFVRQ